MGFNFFRKKPTGEKEEAKKSAEGDGKQEVPKLNSTVSESKKQSIEITPRELKALLDRKEDMVLVDVREPWESQLCMIQSSMLIPLGQLGQRSEELDKSKLTVMYCHSGNRSMFATRQLLSLGFKNVKNLAGGIDLWAEEVDPGMQRY